MAVLSMTEDQWAVLRSHLIPNPHKLEEAAFLFARESIEGSLQFQCDEVRLLGPEDLAVQLSYHIELADHVRGQVIKRAHDMESIIFEVHSHLGEWPVQFSVSDLSGFDEWVPHVRRRLKGRPYGAIVVGSDSFDGFVWHEQEISRLDEIKVSADLVHSATTLSPLTWELSKRF